MAGTDVMCRMAFRYYWVCLVSYSINMLSAIYMKMNNWHWPDIRKRDTFCMSHILANPIQVMACNLWRQSHETRSAGGPVHPSLSPRLRGSDHTWPGPGFSSSAHLSLRRGPEPHEHSHRVKSVTPLGVSIQASGDHKQIKLRDGWREKLMKFGNWKHYRQCM